MTGEQPCPIKGLREGGCDKPSYGTHDQNTPTNKGSGRHLTLSIAQSRDTENGRGDRIIPPAGVLCEFGLRPSIALARGQSNRGSHPIAKIGATGFELEARAS